MPITIPLPIKMFLFSSVGGAFIGLCVAGVRKGVGLMQTFLFGMNINHVSAENVSPWRILAVTWIGSLVLGMLLWTAKRLNRLAIVDPVEANTFRNGKMSLLDSWILVILSSVSISIGGSVGFEAAMTQLGAGSLSFLGQRFHLTQDNLKILVACGAGAGITAIFGAPLAGTFYALELMMPSYAFEAVMPTLLASAMSNLVISDLMGYQPIFPALIDDNPSIWHFPLAVIIGCLATLVGIAVMRGATTLENLLKKMQIKLLFQPFLGSVVLGTLAFFVPQILGPGDIVTKQLLAGDGLHWSAIILFAKILAAVACIGSGFRGGLFSASLLLGASLGGVIYQIMSPFFDHLPADLVLVASMASVACSIIGAPLAMILLMVETANLHNGIFTTAIAVVITSHLTRHWFGYSFSTWRLHLRIIKKLSG